MSYNESLKIIFFIVLFIYLYNLDENDDTPFVISENLDKFVAIISILYFFSLL
jgi:hypothetical protein